MSPIGPLGPISPIRPYLLRRRCCKFEYGIPVSRRTTDFQFPLDEIVREVGATASDRVHDIRFRPGRSNHRGALGRRLESLGMLGLRGRLKTHHDQPSGVELRSRWERIACSARSPFTCSADAMVNLLFHE